MREPRMDCQRDEAAAWAEQDRRRKRFQEEEEKVNRDNLLFGGEEFDRSDEKKK